MPTITLLTTKQEGIVHTEEVDIELKPTLFGIELYATGRTHTARISLDSDDLARLIPQAMRILSNNHPILDSLKNKLLG